MLGVKKVKIWISPTNPKEMFMPFWPFYYVAAASCTAVDVHVKILDRFHKGKPQQHKISHHFSFASWAANIQNLCYYLGQSSVVQL